MKLSKVERLILVHQFLILEKLYPEHEKEYAKERKAVQEGYELQYDAITEHIYDELSVKECKEVMSILTMPRMLKSSFDRLDDKSNIDEDRIKFDGFDGNSETKQMSYVDYFLEDLGHFQDLHNNQDYDSHGLRLPIYRRMLVEWENSPDKYKLSADDIKRILAARTAP